MAQVTLDSGLECVPSANDVYQDYLDRLNRVPWDRAKLKWTLLHTAAPAQYKLWEDAMERGFELCHLKLPDHMISLLVQGRVNPRVYSWWGTETHWQRAGSWADIRKLFRAKFLPPTKLENQQPDVAKVVVCAETAMAEVEPLSGLNMQLKKVHNEACKTVDKGQRWSLFQTQCIIKGKACKLMIDGGSCTNGISKAIVASLGLSTWRIPESKHIQWLNSCGMLKVTHKVRVPFTVGDYVDEIECDVLPLEVCGLLLGRPWQYDRNVTHAGRANIYSFVHDGKQRTLRPMSDDQIKSDVELVIQKARLRKAEPPQLTKLQQEEHDARSVTVDITSAMPVDDRPVLVSDTPVEVQPLTDERKDVAACVTKPVCVDTGVQTDESCADHVSVHRVPRVDDRRHYMSTPMRRFAGAAVRMHTGKDGRVRQLCGPGITHILQGRAKQVHVQQYKVPAKVYKKKKMVAPMPRRVWRRKAPTAESSQELKMAKMRDAVVHITPPFSADPQALGTTLLEGGEDDMGTTAEVQPNFRTPPS